MREILVRGRWTPWWVGLIVAGICVLFGFVIANALATNELGIRVFLPVAALGGYIGLATIVNVRIAEVTPERVRIWLGPVPLGGSVSVPRRDIRHCYARYIVVFQKGARTDSFYTTGVETFEGRQIDVYRRFTLADDAFEAARKLAQVLNASSLSGDAPAHRIEAILANRNPSDRSSKRPLLAWALAFLCATIVGAIWEIQSGGM